jgi:hypothetical protein
MKNITEFELLMQELNAEVESCKIMLKALTEKNNEKTKLIRKWHENKNN